ncbi:hypothetical protein [Streptomyces sp. NPDC047071]|uniref:hypothetical protein n=1 Tax=Streptomyces sp. NPDC047071 TaxID=3154808 RepID=UPI0034528FF3
MIATTVFMHHTDTILDREGPVEERAAAYERWEELVSDPDDVGHRNACRRFIDDSQRLDFATDLADAARRKGARLLSSSARASVPAALRLLAREYRRRS